MDQNYMGDNTLNEVPQELFIENTGGGFMDNIQNSVFETFNYIHNHIETVNGSKIFAGLMIITLNIASRFVNLKISKSVESYLKFTFSRQILVFTMAWMGTRDIYIAFLIMVVFTILIEYVFNEESSYCCLPKSFKDHYLKLIEEENIPKEVGEEEIKTAYGILERAKLQEELKELEQAKLKVQQLKGDPLSLYSTPTDNVNPNQIHNTSKAISDLNPINNDYKHFSTFK